MGRHCGEIRIYFNDEWEGIDLGNVELKTGKTSTMQFTVYPKDMLASHIVFYHSFTETFYFVKRSRMPQIGCKRNVSIKQLERDLAYKITNDIPEMQKEMERIVKDPEKYLNWFVSSRLSQSSKAPEENPYLNY